LPGGAPGRADTCYGRRNRRGVVGRSASEREVRAPRRRPAASEKRGSTHDKVWGLVRRSEESDGWGKGKYERLAARLGPPGRTSSWSCLSRRRRASARLGRPEPATPRSRCERPAPAASSLGSTLPSHAAKAPLERARHEGAAIHSNWGDVDYSRTRMAAARSRFRTSASTCSRSRNVEIGARAVGCPGRTASGSAWKPNPS